MWRKMCLNTTKQPGKVGLMSFWSLLFGLGSFRNGFVTYATSNEDFYLIASNGKSFVFVNRYTHYYIKFVPHFIGFDMILMIIICGGKKNHLNLISSLRYWYEHKTSNDKSNEMINIKMLLNQVSFGFGSFGGRLSRIIFHKNRFSYCTYEYFQKWHIKIRSSYSLGWLKAGHS